MSYLKEEELLEELKNRFNQQRQSLKELEYLTVKLKDLNHKLEDSEKLKSHFLSNIRNEIINPFASIIGLAQNINQLPAEKIDKIHSLSSMIHSEAFALDFQLQNIFAAAEIEAGDLAPQFAFLDINELWESMINLFKHEIDKKQLKINYETNNENINIKSDPQKLKIVFSNLLSNSIKFSQKNGNIDINVFLDKDNLTIKIKDEGVGIEEKLQKIIFDRFKRIDDTINSLNIGHGLGLSVTQAFLELLDGNISVESEINKGALFIVKINKIISAEDIILGEDDVLFESDGEVF